MKKILLSTFITASLIIAGSANVNAQTKAKGDATLVKKDIKATPINNVTKTKDSKSNGDAATVKGTSTTQKKVVNQQKTNSKAIPMNKDLRRKDAEIAPTSKAKGSK